ncbi:HCLS1-associated protein X-1 [Thalassophryne amazonica]|uniref:HCLS1-associated protein X-1 n=1 Tax=Thalassophryne amazonica TaxID=390379 RepID=UPI0014722D88|nr:HCLS1-associated protein X-1 [Thalassophryne amazonica]
MSIFELFRGFFGVPGGRRDPFFESMTRDEEEEDDDGFYYDGFQGDQQDPFDGTWRFGFSFGPDGMRFQEPAAFGEILREMEEIFSHMDQWKGSFDSQEFGVPRFLPPLAEDGGRSGGKHSKRNPLRDFMLKSPDSRQQSPQREPAAEHRNNQDSSFISPGFHPTPFSKFNGIWRSGPQTASEEERREDRDLDSAVSSGGLDQILIPPSAKPPIQPRTSSFFQSVTVTKVVKPDGTVEERRTVRDGHGNEETTVTRSGGPGNPDGPEDHGTPVIQGGQRPFSDMRNEESLLNKFFRGLK